ncbi:MAG: hypothetical protein K6G23_06440, partial [Lachnospiraceae bacterium]|nr:hypothetical protein [Lachnospiraceae bacterium]
GEAQITYQCSATAASDIGTYAITPVGGNRNYDVTAIDGSYTVSKRPITITAGSATAAYEPGISLMKNSYTLTSGSLAAGDRISEIRVSGAQETVGSSANVASDAQIQKGSKDVTGNYEIRYADGTLTVEKGIQQIIASDLTIEYDGRAHRIDEIERYLKYSDETTITVNAAISEITEPGEIEATFTVPESALYLAAEKTVMLRVTKRAITISADSASKFYDGEELSMETWSITRGSLLEGDEIVEDSLSVRAENESGTIVQIGTVANIISGDAVIMRGLTEMTQYYDITYQNGSLSIRSRETQSSGNGGRDGGESGGAAAPDPAEDLQETVQEQETEPREEKEQSEPDGQQAEAESGAQSVIAVWPKITIDLTNEKNEDAQSGGEPVTIDYSKAIVGTVTGGNLSENIAHQRVTITDSEDSNKIIDCDVVSADIERMIEELLSNDEKEVLAEGSNLRFRVEVTRDDENLSEEIRESVTQAMEEKMTIVGMFDASFFVKIGNGDETRINDPYSSVRVSFTIPDELWDASMVGNAQILRTYRNADGVLVTEVAVAEITDQTVVMDADNYSAYTLVNGVVTATIHGELEDDCYIHWLILCLLIIALYSVAHFYRKKRREVREEKASGEEITPDRGQRRHRLWLLVVNAAGLILFFYGSCHWDLIALIALILGSGGAELIASHRYINFLEQQDL